MGKKHKKDELPMGDLWGKNKPLVKGTLFTKEDKKGW